MAQRMYFDETYDKDGNVIESHVVPDKGRLSVRLLQMDHDTADEHDEDEVEQDDTDDDASKLDVIDTDDPVYRAYQERNRRISDAWKSPAAVPAVPPAPSHHHQDAEAAWHERNRRLSEAWRKP